MSDIRRSPDNFRLTVPPPQRGRNVLGAANTGLNNLLRTMQNDARERRRMRDAAMKGAYKIQDDLLGIRTHNPAQQKILSDIKESYSLNDDSVSSAIDSGDPTLVRQMKTNLMRMQGDQNFRRLIEQVETMDKGLEWARTKAAGRNRQAFEDAYLQYSQDETGQNTLHNSWDDFMPVEFSREEKGFLEPNVNTRKFEQPVEDELRFDKLEEINVDYDNLAKDVLNRYNSDSRFRTNVDINYGGINEYIDDLNRRNRSQTAYVGSRKMTEGELRRLAPIKRAGNLQETDPEEYERRMQVAEEFDIPENQRDQFIVDFGKFKGSDSERVRQYLGEPKRRRSETQDEEDSGWAPSTSVEKRRIAAASEAGADIVTARDYEDYGVLLKDAEGSHRVAAEEFNKLKRGRDRVYIPVRSGDNLTFGSRKQISDLTDVEEGQISETDGVGWENNEGRERYADVIEEGGDLYFETNSPAAFMDALNQGFRDEDEFGSQADQFKEAQERANAESYDSDEHGKVFRARISRDRGEVVELEPTQSNEFEFDGYAFPSDPQYAGLEDQSTSGEVVYSDLSTGENEIEIPEPKDRPADRKNVSWYTNNPLNLKGLPEDTSVVSDVDNEGDAMRHRVFPNMEAGLEAAQRDIEAKMTGRSRVIDLQDNLETMYKKFATSATAKKIKQIADILGVEKEITMEELAKEKTPEEVTMAIMSVESPEIYKEMISRGETPLNEYDEEQTQRLREQPTQPQQVDSTNLRNKLDDFFRKQ